MTCIPHPENKKQWRDDPGRIGKSSVPRDSDAYSPPNLFKQDDDNVR